MPGKRQIQNIKLSEVWDYLNTNPKGLNGRAVKERLAEVGPNSFEMRDPYKTLKSFLRQFTNFFTILLGISAGICFVADNIQPGENMDVLGYALFGVAFLNAFFSFIQEFRAEKAMEALKKFLPQKVKVKREDKVQEVLAEELVPGDLLFLAEGDRVAADARIVKINNLLVNNAPLTGESAPVSLICEPSSKRLEESPNIAFAGCSVLRGNAEAVVFATGLRTEFGKLARLSQAIKRSASPLEKETSHMVRVLTLIATIMGLTFFFYGVFTERPLWVNLVFMMGIIVANVPEGLLPTFTLSLAMGSLRMAKKNVLVKGLNAVESLGAVHVICTDKTGTLTKNDLSLTSLRNYANEEYTEKSQRSILEFARFASEVLQTQTGLSGDPLDIEIHEQLEKRGGFSSKYKILHYFPFDTSLRRSSCIVEKDGETWYAVKGAWEALFPAVGSFYSNESLSKKIASKPESVKTAQKTMEYMAAGGLRVLCVAVRKLKASEVKFSRGHKKLKQDTFEKDLTFAGFLGVEDPVRPEVAPAVEKCYRAGIDIILITGDHPDTAVAVASKCKIVQGKNPEVITGAELEKLTKEQLIRRLHKGVRIFARSTPEQKMKIVSALQMMEKVTAMTGDGVNDAPALKAADVGIAMGKEGTDVARESAQIILLDDNFASIVSGIEEGRTVFANIRKFTNYVLVSNGPEILPYLLYILLPVPLALNVIQILSIDLGTDIIPSMALGQEPPDPEEMKKPPRKNEKNLMDFKLILHSYFFLGLLEGSWSIFLFFLVLVRGGWSFGEIPGEDNTLYRSAMGIALSTILLMQIGNLIGRRFIYKSGLDRGIFRNKLMLAGIVIQVVFSWATLYFEPMQKILHTAPVDTSIYLLSWFGILLIFGSDFIRKKIAKRWFPAPMGNSTSKNDGPDVVHG